MPDEKQNITHTEYHKNIKKKLFKMNKNQMLWILFQ